MADRLAQYYEDHHFYPILHYFRMEPPLYSLPRITYIVLETVSLIRSAFREHESEQFRDSASVESLWQAGILLVQNLPKDVLPRDWEKRIASATALHSEWREDYSSSLARLKAAGVCCQSNEEQSYLDYAEQRQKWDAPIRAFSQFLRFESSEIASKEKPR